MIWKLINTLTLERRPMDRQLYHSQEEVIWMNRKILRNLNSVIGQLLFYYYVEA